MKNDEILAYCTPSVAKAIELAEKVRNPQPHQIWQALKVVSPETCKALVKESGFDSLAKQACEHHGTMSYAADHIIRQAVMEAKIYGKKADVQHVVLALMDSPMSTAFQGNGISRTTMLERIDNLEKATNALDAFTTDMVADAKLFDPIIGRDAEIEVLVRVLARRTKNNPVMIGHPGIGKSAIAIGLSQRLADGNVPEKLKNWRMLSLDLNTLLAGTGLAGELEARVTAILEELREQKEPVILFVDEVHKIVGGGGSGSQDIANMLKPALARGEMHMVGATTANEYRQYIEKDGALERRFQPVYIEEPTPEETHNIIVGIAPYFAKFHAVTIDETAMSAAVKLSIRYVTSRYLPDKAIDLLDETSAMVSLATRRKRVNGEDVAKVLSSKIGVPLEKLTASDAEKLKGIETALASRLVGQKNAIEAVSNAIRRARSGLQLRKRPVGVFMFLGPTGVGKTEMARTLAWWMFDDPENVIRLDMSEFQEPHTVSRLFGSPPGYVGHGAGGELTEPVIRRPYSVVLLDEIEKAHPDVWNTLLSIMDAGRMTDSQGRVANFQNTVVIMTTNAHPELWKMKGQSRKVIEGRLTETFRPEFINRFDDLVVFEHLTPGNLVDIALLRLGELSEMAKENGYEVSFDKSVSEHLAETSHNDNFGARPLIRNIETNIMNPLALAFAAGNIREKSEIEFTIVEGEYTLTQKG